MRHIYALIITLVSITATAQDSAAIKKEMRNQWHNYIEINYSYEHDGPRIVKQRGFVINKLPYLIDYVEITAIYTMPNGKKDTAIKAVRIIPAGGRIGFMMTENKKATSMVAKISYVLCNGLSFAYYPTKKATDGPEDDPYYNVPGVN